MPSFDIVSELDMGEVDNAINQVVKEISNRFDFRGGKSVVTLDKASSTINIVADDELKLRSIQQIIEQKMSKRNIDIRCLEYGAEVEGSGNVIKQTVKLKKGIEKEEAKKITKMVKETKLKVQSQIQDQQVRITGKKIDDLQTVMQHIKSSSFELPLQFINMRS